MTASANADYVPVDKPAEEATEALLTTAPDLDEIAIECRISGDKTVRLTQAETAEAHRRLNAQGLSATQIADRLGVEPRTVQYHRARLSATENVPTSEADRRPTPILVTPPGSGLALGSLIAAMSRDGYDDPEAFADAVLARLDPESLRDALRQALTYWCRAYVVRPRAAQPTARPEPAEPDPEPAPGPVRKIIAATVLELLPKKLDSRVNVGSVRLPQWKALGDCTAADLVEAIGIRQELARVHASEAEFYVAVLDQMTDTDAQTVRDLLRLRRAG